MVIMGINVEENDSKQQQYVLDNNQELKLMAKVELREDEETRNHALATMREWIAKHPDIINCRTGTNIVYSTESTIDRPLTTSNWLICLV